MLNKERLTYFGDLKISVASSIYAEITASIYPLIVSIFIGNLELGYTILNGNLNRKEVIHF